MQLSHSTIKKEYINVNDTYTIMPLLRMSEKPYQSQQDVKMADNSKKEVNKKTDEDIDLYTRNVLDRAKSEGQSIIEKANIESEKLKNQGYDTGHDEGYNDGFKKGKDEGIKQSQDMRKEAGEIIEEAHRISREYIDGRKEEIVNLALSIAEKITGYKCSLDDDDEVINKILNDSISNCVAKKQLLIMVNPMDYALVDCRRDEISKKIGEKVILSIIRDSSIKRGGCRIESESSLVDADIDSQLERIKEALLAQNV